MSRINRTFVPTLLACAVALAACSSSSSSKSDSTRTLPANATCEQFYAGTIVQDAELVQTLFPGQTNLHDIGKLEIAAADCVGHDSGSVVDAIKDQGREVQVFLKSPCGTAGVDTVTQTGSSALSGLSGGNSN